MLVHLVDMAMVRREKMIKVKKRQPKLSLFDLNLTTTANIYFLSRYYEPL